MPARSTDASALITSAAGRLRAAGIETPGTDARLLAAHALSLTHKELALGLLRGISLDPGQQQAFSAALDRRLAREPLQYIVGTTGFRYLDLAVGPGVFVPRPETELLIDPAIAFAAGLRAGEPDSRYPGADHLGHGEDRPAGTAPAPQRLRILDLCTGSGALALAAATEIPHVDVTAVELSADACRWAERNIADHREAIAAAGSTLELRCGDIASVVPQLEGCDIVLANPPYVPRARQPEIPEVTGYDPQLALYGGGEAGMDMPARVIALAAGVLRSPGLLVIEHDETQGAAIRAVCAQLGLRRARTHTDYTGRDRFTTAETESPSPST